METFDNDLHKYLNEPDTLSSEEIESLDCDLFDKSACCNAPLQFERCSDCKEWSESCCIECDIKQHCINENKIEPGYKPIDLFQELGDCFNPKNL